MSLGKIYFDPKYTAGFGSVAKLVKAGKRNKTDVEEWLSGQDTYTLHKPVRKKFPRNPYTVTNIDDVWEMDLADLSSLSRYNDKYRYLLNVIDVFSRFAWSLPLKDKTGKSVVAALRSLFQNRKPITLQSDKCTEFLNNTVQQYLKREVVDFHTTNNPDLNAAVIERFNRTLKTRMYKYFTKYNTYRYLNIINDLVAIYNRAVQSKIGIAPGDISPFNIYALWRRVNCLAGKIPCGCIKFKVGDLARIAKHKVKFAKGYEQTFSTEIFLVAKVIYSVPVLITLSIQSLILEPNQPHCSSYSPIRGMWAC